jgi:hypothetical protein
MIVNDYGKGMLQLVRQPDHAAMSAQMARAWRRPAGFDAPLWDAVIDAVEHHDDGWAESEKLPLLDDDGRPLDFKTMPTQTHTIIWRRSVTAARQRDALTGLFVALYARWLYTSEAASHVDDDRIAQQFVNELTTQIAEDIDRLSQESDARRAAVEPKNLQTVVRLVSLFDALSLAMLGGLSWFDATEPLAFADQDSALTLQYGEQGQILVDPWPFGDKQVMLTVAAREVRAKRYKYPLEIAEGMTRAKPLKLSWTLQQF